MKTVNIHILLVLGLYIWCLICRYSQVESLTRGDLLIYFDKGMVCLSSNPPQILIIECVRWWCLIVFLWCQSLPDMYILKRVMCTFYLREVDDICYKGPIRYLAIVYLCINLSFIEIIEGEDKHAIFLRLWVMHCSTSSGVKMCFLPHCLYQEFTPSICLNIFLLIFNIL